MNERMLPVIGALLGAAALTLTFGTPPALAEDAAAKPVASAPTQTFYTSPEAAAKALYDVVKTGDLKLTEQVLGAESSQLVYTGDDVADQQMRERFLASFDAALKIDLESADKAVLSVGKNQWPFPYPLRKSAQGWQFDASAGADEIINRRIGENELFAMKFCLAYGDAQREYAETDRDGDHLYEYAQRFRSRPGKRDGLFWRVGEGEPESPLGPLAAQAVSEGYTPKDAEPIPYHGYYYRILTAQGPRAPGGGYDYLVNGNMIGGYALVAYPARWGASGVMTFTCNHDGVVYEKNLGAETAAIAAKIKIFDPDPSWQKAE